MISIVPLHCIGHQPFKTLFPVAIGGCIGAFPHLWLSPLYTTLSLFSLLFMGNPRKKTPKHKDPVLLGLPDGSIDASEDVDAYITKIGGVPVS